MTLTNFRNGISSFGIPVIGGGGIPATKGKVYWVDYGSGLDGPGRGGSPARALKTIAEAYSRVTTNNDDVIALIGSATHVLTEMLDITKSRVHMIGVDATGGRLYGANAKVSLGVTTAATDVFTMKNTGVRNSFHNIKFMNSNTVAQGLHCVGEGGEYALYEHCEIYKSTDLDETTASELVMNGDSAQFKRCTIGSLADAIAGSSIIRPCVELTKDTVASGKVCRDSIFEDCLLWRQCKDTSNVFMNCGNAADIERMLALKGCLFVNNLAAANKPAVCIRLAATLTVGNIILDPNCAGFNITKIATGTGVLISGAAPNSGTGIATNAA